MEVRGNIVSSIPAVVKAYPGLTTPFSYLIHCLKSYHLKMWHAPLTAEPQDGVTEFVFRGNFIETSNCFDVRIGKKEMTSPQARHFMRVYRKAIKKRMAKGAMRRFGTQ